MIAIFQILIKIWFLVFDIMCINKIVTRDKKIQIMIVIHNIQVMNIYIV